MKESSKSILFILFFCFSNFAKGSEISFKPKYILALGLTYEDHLKEAREEVDHLIGPPIFVKNTKSFLPKKEGNVASIPSESEILLDAEKLEPGISNLIREKYSPGTFPIMLDYEGELGIYFHEDLRLDELEKDFLSPDKMSFFVANDLSLRSLHILGEGQVNRHQYWGISKSFKTFLPVSGLKKTVNALSLNEWPDLLIETYVNNELRQSASLATIAYSPKELFGHIIKRIGLEKIPAGTALLTGTPSGVALRVSWLKKTLATYLKLNRFSRLKLMAKQSKGPKSLYLKHGDKVSVRIESIGEVTTYIK